MVIAAAEEEPDLERRVAALLDVAELHGVGLTLEELLTLLPEPGPRSIEEVGQWLADRPGLGPVVDRQLFPPSGPYPPSVDRRARAERFLAEAHRAAGAELGPVRPLARAIAVTGSTAYGASAAGDDLDFLVVTRRGAVWPFLLYAYLAARRRFRSVDGPTAWCFNYVLDEAAMRKEIATPQGLLYAREALTARPVHGAEFYRDLLATAAWLREVLPRLTPRSAELAGAPPVERPAPGPIRAANLLLFPWMAAYLQLVALVRNARFRRRGEGDRGFRVVASPRRLTYETVRYARIGAIYRRHQREATEA